MHSWGPRTLGESLRWGLEWFSSCYQSKTWQSEHLLTGLGHGRQVEQGRTETLVPFPATSDYSNSETWHILSVHWAVFCLQNVCTKCGVETSSSRPHPVAQSAKSASSREVSGWVKPGSQTIVPVLWDRGQSGKLSIHQDRSNSAQLPYLHLPPPLLLQCRRSGHGSSRLPPNRSSQPYAHKEEQPQQPVSEPVPTLARPLAQAPLGLQLESRKIQLCWDQDRSWLTGLPEESWHHVSFSQLVVATSQPLGFGLGPLSLSQLTIRPVQSTLRNSPAIQAAKKALLSADGSV